MSEEKSPLSEEVMAPDQGRCWFCWAIVPIGELKQVDVDEVWHQEWLCEECRA